MPAVPIYQIVFYLYAAGLLASAVMMIVSHNPVRALLFLVLAFFCSAVLWMLLQAEFLSLVLIFVYVGAVMTLFLFVVMMLNIDMAKLKEGFVRFLPYALLVMVLLVGTMWVVLSSPQLPFATLAPLQHAADYSNTREMGVLLYTDYIYAFEIAAFILLVAIVAAISLAFHGRRASTKSQRVASQLQADRKQRLRIVDMKAEKS